MHSKQRTFQILLRATAIALAGFGLSACAYVTQNPDGSANVVGLAAVSMHQTPGAPPGNVTVRSHGLTLTDTPPAQGLVVGVYDQQMQFGQPKPVVQYQTNNRGEIDFVGRSRASGGQPVYDDYRPHKRKHGRKKKRCRCR